MARIAPVPRDRQTPLVRLLNRGARRLLGREAAPLNVIADYPGFVVPYLATTRFVRGRTHLDPEVRALATQLVAAINGCSWCLDFGRVAAEHAGIDAAKLLAVTNYATDPRFLPDERAALAYAAAATEVGARVPDDLFAELRRHFADRDIVELTMAVAVENMYNRNAAPLEIAAQGFCAVPVASARRARATAAS